MTVIRRIGNISNSLYLATLSSPFFRFVLILLRRISIKKEPLNQTPMIGRHASSLPLPFIFHRNFFFTARNFFLPFVYCDAVRNDDEKAISTFCSRSINLALYMVMLQTKKKVLSCCFLSLNSSKCYFVENHGEKVQLFWVFI